jgi:hypothetical protein
MATKLGKVDSRSITRETADHDGCYHERLMVKLDAGGRYLEVWQKGRRRHFKVTYAEIFNHAVMREMRASERERRLEKKAKREERLRLRRA